MKKIKKKIRKIFKNNLKTFILAIGVIMIWRGVWNFLDHYFIPDLFVLSNILTIILGILILFLNDRHLEELGVNID